MSVAHESLDLLVAGGFITGYTREDSIAYLTALRPTLTYSMYVDGAASQANRRSFASHMRAIGGRTRESSQVGQLGTGRGVQRTRQVRVIVEFDDETALSAALDVVLERFMAGSPSEVTGSWVYPDVRITGSTRRRSGTMPALAHVSRAGDEALVVLSTSARPPLPGMSVSTLHVLDCWQALPGFLDPDTAP